MIEMFGDSLEGTRLVLQEEELVGTRLRILDCESWEDIYSLQLSTPTALAHCSLSQESLFLSEAIR